ncbi:MAG: sulfotransferase [Caldilineaceae bacterium]|nr:sulfotransferase [Caldilineaceae bacterium]
MTLPNFIIIGVAKGGTTSLYHYLDQHPQVFMSPIKETNFFACEEAHAERRTGEKHPPNPPYFRAKTLQEYEALFAGVSGEIAIGEASPRYFACPTTARRIHDCIPEVKLVASLRNPADRAFSGFLMRVRKGRAALDIPERLTSESHHVKEGFYYNQLKRYFDVFPKEQIKICLFEEFKEDPARVVQDLFKFLGVDTNHVLDTSIRHNPGAIPKNRLLNRLFYHPALISMAKSVLPESMQGLAKRVTQQNLKSPPEFPPDLRAELLQLYRADILNLQDLLNRDLSIWLNEA